MTTAIARNLDLASALADAEERFTRANPDSKRRYDGATKVMPGGNTRTVLFFGPFPLTIARGEGCQLWDTDGHRYVDFLGEYSAGLYGHSNPIIRAAIERALADGIALGGHNKVEAELASLVCARFPSLERVRFCNSGTEANLFALVAARAHTGRNKIMVMQGGYHGGVFYFSGDGSPINAPFSFVKTRYNDIEGTLKLIELHARDLAAVIVEPMMGGGGCIAADAEFLRMLREATRKHGVVLIFDEVMTSRLTPSGLQGKHGITPDLTTLGKYIGGGLTFGGFGGRAEIMDRFDPRRPDAWPHAGTFNNNILTMSAGAAGLSQVYTPEVAVSFNARGDKLRARLNALAEKRGLPVQFTGIGSMMTVHVLRGAIRSPDDLARKDKRWADLFHLDMIGRGYYLARRGMITLSLPMTDADLDGFAQAIEDWLDERRDLIAAGA
ncbi:MAG: aminotransferase class III-fold pyridoxal phosphate-dependent enzyme [Alphaproteobacteria bacterium]|nr:aminotransferase class III-fold pyridoxal phosphate-dependent enzyme [Alphaproteobacteria bacterium]